MVSLLTGHEIFDYISSLQEGSALLILDETGFESTMFMKALLESFPDKKKIIFISVEPSSMKFQVKRIDLEKIPDITVLSLEIQKIRSTLKGEGILIHGYLPHVLVREEEDRILKVIESWRERAANNRIVEIFLLRTGAFSSFEKKLQTLVAGSIIIEVPNSKDQKESSFKMVGGCKAEYHLQSFPYSIKENRLLIKWGDEFTDKLPLEGEEAIKNRFNYLKENVNFLRIIEGEKFEWPNPYDRWLFSQVKGKSLSELNLIFPEKFNQILEKLALWSIKGFLKFELMEKVSTPLSQTKLKLSTRLALLLPTNMSLFFLRRRAHTIPLKAYNTLRRSVEAFMSERIPGRKLDEELSEIELRFQEMTARMSTIETVRELKEDPRIKPELKYLPKIISLMMYYGYGLKPKINRINDMEYEVTFPDCFICEGITSEGMFCKLLAGTMVGCCSVLFKKPFSCEEIKCKASKAKACVFTLKMEARPFTRILDSSHTMIPSFVKTRI